MEDDFRVGDKLIKFIKNEPSVFERELEIGEHLDDNLEDMCVFSEYFRVGFVLLVKFLAALGVFQLVGQHLEHLQGFIHFCIGTTLVLQEVIPAGV